MELCIHSFLIRVPFLTTGVDCCKIYEKHKDINLVVDFDNAPSLG